MKNKKVISLRTKAEVILVACFLICLSVVSVMSVTRTITDTSDNVDTFIRNSNGKYWEATGANIQTAIDDLNNSGWAGWVKIPVGTYMIPTGSPIRTYNLTMTLQGTASKFDSTTGKRYGTLFTTTWNGGTIGDYIIEVGGSSAEYPSATRHVIIENIAIYGNGNEGLQWSGGIKLENAKTCIVRNCDIGYFYNLTLNQCGINVTGDGGINSYYNRIENCFFYRCPVGIKFSASSNANTVIGGVINSNQNIPGDFPIGIWIYDAGTNWVMNIDIENFEYGTGIMMEKNAISWQGANNNFIGVRFEGNNRDVYVKNGGGNNRFVNCFSSSVDLDFIDDGDQPSYLLNCYGMNYSYCEFGDFGDNYVNINATGAMNFSGLAKITLPVVAANTPADGTMYYNSANATLAIYDISDGCWHYFEHNG